MITFYSQTHDFSHYYFVKYSTNSLCLVVPLDHCVTIFSPTTTNKIAHPCPCFDANCKRKFHWLQHGGRRWEGFGTRGAGWNISGKWFCCKLQGAVGVVCQLWLDGVWQGIATEHVYQGFDFGWRLKTTEDTFAKTIEHGVQGLVQFLAFFRVGRTFTFQKLTRQWAAKDCTFPPVFLIKLFEIWHI